MMMKNNTVKSIVLSTLMKHKGLSFALLICSVGLVIGSLIPPLLLKQVIDMNLIPASSEGLLNLTLMMVLVTIGIGGTDFLKGLVLTNLGQKITTQLRSQSMAKIHRLDPSYFSETMEGETVSRIINDTEAIDVLFTGGIVNMMIDLLKIIGILFSIFLLSLRIGYLTLILIPFIVLLTRLFQKGMLKAQRRSRDLIGRMNQQVSESLRNVLVIKANGHEETMMNRFQKTLIQHIQSNETINTYDSLFPTVIQVTRALSIGVLILSFLLGNNLIISIGTIVAAIELISNLFDPIENVGSELQSIQQAIAAMDRVDEYLASKEETPREQHFDIKEVIMRDNILRFNHVSFEYEKDQNVLKDIHLEIHGGQQVSFVGRTGVGKSTLLKLILGLIPASQGDITLNGVDVFKIPHSAQRQLYGSVDQNFPLIKGTLRQQITLGDNSIPESKILLALEKVGLKQLSIQSDKGLDAMIPKELQLSEGQKQLVSIARAIVLDPPILILDEISSGLDAISAVNVYEVLRKVNKNRIVLSVTHRLSSLRDDEDVVILHEGKIRLKGKAKELKESDPWFKKALQLEKLALK
jgi:ATP-binding cassette, subfamily B, multidrug efflux pump